jgi:hypothetical protein
MGNSAPVGIDDGCAAPVRLAGRVDEPALPEIVPVPSEGV